MYNNMDVCTLYVCVCVCMYMCMYVCMYVQQCTLYNGYNM